MPWKTRPEGYNIAPGAEPVGDTPVRFEAFRKAERVKRGRGIKTLKLTLDWVRRAFVKKP